MTVTRLDHPLVHKPWTHRWFEGDDDLASVFGAPPSPRGAWDVAQRIDARGRRDDWRAALLGRRATTIADDAFVVLAGQQPVLAGGAALVAHKAASAIAAARVLSGLWDRQVVPLFLLATQDHDTSEVDHVDVAGAHDGLRRLRCPIAPRHDAFHRAHWNDAVLRDVLAELTPDDALRARLLESLDPQRFSSHVATLLDETFGDLGLVTVDAHELEPAGRDVLARALADPEDHRRVLVDGAAALARHDLRSAFDVDDPRPLVLESSDGQRRRIEHDDDEAGARHAASPLDFSPHAALRPIVQAAALPVVAQVCGPSEIVYLGQARGLHALHDATAPQLVPRLEATWVRDADSHAAAVETLHGSDVPIVGEEAALRDAADAFVSAVAARDADLAPRLRRWSDALTRSARRLAEAPSFRGRPADARTTWLRPRGRAQDAVLAWLPQLDGHAPPAWGAHVVSLARPFDPPTHVLHSGPR